MQGDRAVIDLLNEVLTGELTAVNQYFADAKMCANWGYDRLAEKFREESIGEMKDADELIERILYLDGLPNVQRLSAVRIGETPKEKLELALALEVDAIERLNAGVTRCAELGDTGTRDVLADVLHGEEEHADFLGTQLQLVNQLGDAAYLAQQIHA
jgi:bacterioferritin